MSTLTSLADRLIADLWTTWGQRVHDPVDNPSPRPIGQARCITPDRKALLLAHPFQPLRETAQSPQIMTILCNTYSDLRLFTRERRHTHASQGTERTKAHELPTHTTDPGMCRRGWTICRTSPRQPRSHSFQRPQEA